MAGVSACAAPPTVSRAGIAGRQAVPRSQPGHAGHGHGPLPTEGHRGASVGQHQRRGPGRAGPVGPRPRDACSRAHRWAGGRRLARGRRLPPERRYDRRTQGPPVTALAWSMLGVPQEVVAPVDGILGEQLVDGGEAVEYGQDLVVIEFAEAPAMDG